MGKHFGELATNVRGIVYYKLSPHEMRAYAGAISYGLPNVLLRFRASVLRVAPPFIIGYLWYQGVEHAYHMRGRKNPKDYINEVDPNPPPPPPPPPTEKKKC